MISRVAKRFRRMFRRKPAPLVGLMAQYSDLTSDAALDGVIKRYAEVWGSGNGGKWIAMLNGSSTSIHDLQWDIEMDDAVQYAEDNGLLYYYHTLLWSKEDFFPTAANVVGGTYDITTRAAREPDNNQHITDIVTRYKGRVFAYDVWNEVIDGTGNIESTGGVETLTVDEIGASFDLAHSIDPNAILLYNDFGCETPGNRQNGVYTLCSDLIDAGHAIHGVGFQFHITLDGTEPTYQEMVDLFQRFRALRGGAFRVFVTELDLAVASIAGDANKLAAQAAFCKDLARAARETGVDVIRWWGATDQYSWVYGRDLTTYPTEKPLPFNDNGTVKPAWTSLIEYVKK